MTATERAVDVVHTAARAASDKLADGIVAFDVSEQLVITDAFLICSAPNDRQVRAIVDESVRIGAEYLLVEQDDLYGRTALECLQTSYDNLVALGYQDLFEGATSNRSSIRVPDDRDADRLP